jgi:hypothetical protein
MSDGLRAKPRWCRRHDLDAGMIFINERRVVTLSRTVCDLAFSRNACGSAIVICSCRHVVAPDALLRVLPCS